MRRLRLHFATRFEKHYGQVVFLSGKVAKGRLRAREVEELG